MKKLSDYTGNEAIELWADLLIPVTEIITDKNIQNAYKTKKTKVELASAILKEHSKDAAKILLRIDPTPLNGINAITRVIDLVVDFENAEEMKSFFGSAGQAQMANASSGLHTVNTEGEEN